LSNSKASLTKSGFLLTNYWFFIPYSTLSFTPETVNNTTMETKKNNLKKIQMKLISFILIISAFNCTSEQAKAELPPDNESAKNIKIALLLDTSNSMDGLIEQAKSQLWQLVNELAKARCESVTPSLGIALYEYGNDNLSAREGYIRQVTPLTDDLDQISEDLFNLTTNGGSEYCGHVIQTAVNQQEWSRSSGDLQIIFIAGNEPFTQGKVNYLTACTNAKEKNIIVNTIHCGSFEEGIQGMWKDGADRAGGQFMCIEQDRKTVFIPSPYDDKITTLNEKLNDTYISYGNLGQAKKEAQKVQDSNAASYSSANTVKRAVSKSSHFYKNASWDLVDASKEKDFKLEEVSESHLPNELQGKTLEEKELYIAQKANEREKIKSEINTLNKKRQQYVSDRQKETGEEEMLDKVMIKAIKEQAKTKEFSFEE
jgi:hypothetical protein